MFWALATGRVPPAAYGFDRVDFQTADTETLNRCADGEEADVVAISIAHFAAIADRYQLLPHGGSVGRGYGPVLVARRPVPKEALASLVIGVPGARTTAARLVSAAIPGARTVVVPFHQTLAAIDEGRCDAVVLIHEGRLVYERLGYRLLLDLGAWWADTTGLPLPLGGNAIRRALGSEAIARASAMLRDSIAHALAHRDEAIEELLSARPGMTRADADLYLSLYANRDTLDYGPDGRAAVERLLGRPVDWAP